MSVTIVGNTGINAITHAASKFIFKHGKFISEKLPAHTFDVVTIGQYLYQRNMDAFNQRYGENNPAPRFQLHHNDVPAILTLAAIDAYLYQVSDLNDEELYNLLRNTRLHTIQHMDGYDEAWYEAMRD